MAVTQNQQKTTTKLTHIVRNRIHPPSQNDPSLVSQNVRNRIHPSSLKMSITF